MDLNPNGEEEQVAQAAADFLRRRLPMSRLHARDDGVVTLPTLREIAQLGWIGMALDEARGGVGFSVVEEMLVYREIGRVLGPTAVLPLALAARTAALSGEDALARKLLNVEIGAGLAFVAPDGVAHVFDGLGAAVCVTVAPDGAAVHRLDPAACVNRLCLDKSITLAATSLDEARVLARLEEPGIYRAGVLATAAMLTGLAETALAMSVEYAKVRHTFGRPIGAYQAVRHPCADMAVRCEAARAQLFFAAVALRDGRDDVAMQLAAAKVLANAAAVRNADASIQLHGGIGITDEFDAHLVMKRAQVLSRWFGDDRAALRDLLENRAS
ncbi:MAG: acyl-CoA dehydrogenase family protein [Hyphomonadaceae bacterium]